MLKLKYKSRRIKDLKEEEKQIWSKALLVKIHVITGWVIPKDDRVLTVLTDQFYKIINEKYYDMNVDEIEYAFRTYGTQREDWGKEMNLNLIDSILIPYKNSRYELSRTEDMLALPEQQLTQEQKDNIAREFAEVHYQQFLSGSEEYFLFNPEISRDILIKDGLLDNESVADFFERKKKVNQENIYIKD